MQFYVNRGNIVDLDYFVEIPLRKALTLFLNLDLDTWVSGQHPVNGDTIESVMFEYMSSMIESYIRINTLPKLKEFQSKLRDLCHHLFIGYGVKDNDYSSLLIKKIEYTISFDTKSKTFFEYYSIEYIDAFCMFAATRLYSDGAILRKCENCGDFFIPSSRADEIYCDKIIRDNKTCKDLGYINKVNSDELTKAYRTAYKAKNAYKIRNINNSPGIQERFESWVIQARQKLQEAKAGRLSADEFKAWLKNS